MNIIDVGSGTPVVIIPGIQGRWEWMKLAVDALSTRCRVITFSLADEPTSGTTFDESAGIWSYVQQVVDVLDASGLQEATICGVSYAGVIASAFAARHPHRVTSLVMMSAIPPSWRPDARLRFLMRSPRLLSPLFCIGSARLLPEIIAAKGLLPGIGFAAAQSVNVLGHFFSPRLMARRARMVATLDIDQELARVHRPTLVVTGEDGLDRVVPVRFTREYLKIWPHATEAVLSRTGHLGPMTRADTFASLIATFAERATRDEGQKRRIV
jgi:3-oxoadipate enol-lactonase/4-carboxymuconolactone decarboxylase